MIISLISDRLNQNTCIQVGIWLIQGLVSITLIVIYYIKRIYLNMWVFYR